MPYHREQKKSYWLVLTKRFPCSTAPAPRGYTLFGESSEKELEEGLTVSGAPETANDSAPASNSLACLSTIRRLDDEPLSGVSIHELNKGASFFRSCF